MPAADVVQGTPEVVARTKVYTGRRWTRASPSGKSERIRHVVLMNSCAGNSFPITVNYP